MWVCEFVKQSNQIPRHGTFIGKLCSKNILQNVGKPPFFDSLLSKMLLWWNNWRQLLFIVMQIKCVTWPLLSVTFSRFVFFRLSTKATKIVASFFSGLYIWPDSEIWSQNCKFLLLNKRCTRSHDQKQKKWLLWSRSSVISDFEVKNLRDLLFSSSSISSFASDQNNICRKLISIHFGQNKFQWQQISPSLGL